jgi:prevent-host-death family protein
MGQTATLGTFDAKTRFSEIISNVESGADYIITKRGKPVAKIIPFVKEDKRMEWGDFLSYCEEFRKHYRGKPGDFNIKEAIEEGRR